MLEAIGIGIAAVAGITSLAIQAYQWYCNRPYDIRCVLGLEAEVRGGVLLVKATLRNEGLRVATIRQQGTFLELEEMYSALRGHSEGWTVIDRHKLFELHDKAHSGEVVSDTTVFPMDGIELDILRVNMRVCIRGREYNMSRIVSRSGQGDVPTSTA